jgi:hypothetical protein
MDQIRLISSRDSEADQYRLTLAAFEKEAALARFAPSLAQREEPTVAAQPDAQNRESLSIAVGRRAMC